METLLETSSSAAVETQVDASAHVVDEDAGIDDEQRDLELLYGEPMDPLVD
jgi:hypothetical protein